MEIIGTWKAGKILFASDAGETFITVEEFLALPDEQKDDAMALLARSFFSIKQDGTMTVFFDVDEETTNVLREEGVEIVDGKYAVLYNFTWREENGTYFYSCEEFEIDNLPMEFDNDGGAIINGTIIYYKIA